MVQLVRKFRAALLGAVLGAGLTSSAAASTILLDAATMDHSRTVTIDGVLSGVRDAPMQFTAVYNGQPISLLAWCVDVYHEISVRDYSPDLPYTDTTPLTTDFHGNPLDTGDTYKIGVLANYGQELFDDAPVAPPAFTETAPVRSSYPSGATGLAEYNAAKAAYNADKTAHTAAVNAYNAAVTNRYMLLDAVQAAIWQVASDRNVHSADATFDALVDQMSDHTGAYLQGVGFDLSRDDYTLITPIQLYGGRSGTTPLALTQSFVFATGYAPEPGAWALMLMGVGAIGGALRARRRPAAAVA